MTPRRFRSLASRLVVVGVVQMVLVSLISVTVWFAEGPHEPADPDDTLTPAEVARLESLAGSPAELAAALDDLRTDRIEVSIYDDKRQLLASNVDPALAVPHLPLEHHRRDADRDVPLALPPGDERGLLLPPAGEGRGGRPPLPDDDLGAPPLPPPGLRGPPRGPFGSHHRMLIPFHTGGDMPGLLIARGVNAAPGLAGPLFALGGGLAVLIIGALITARWIVRPIDRLSRTARALGTGDLQARSRLDRADEIGELGHRFDEMAERIETLLVTEKELLANVAHELRTPLTRIGVALDLANEGDAEAARASLEEIAVDVSELETIVDDILTAMRFELATTKGAAQLPLRRAVVAPSEIATAAAERLRARHPERPLEVRLDERAGDIHVDPVLFRRVIDNLLQNAHKYTTDPTSQITLAVEPAPDHVVFEVADHGIGISADDLPRIFTAFFRGDRSRSRETGGVGLGLTLAKRIVEAHDGAIEVTSTPNVGTTFRVRVPTA